MDFVNFIRATFVFFLPGVLGMLLYNYLNAIKEFVIYIQAIKVILISFFSFLFTDGIFWLLDLIFENTYIKPVNIIKYITNTSNAMPISNMCVAMIFSLIIAIIFTKLDSHNTIFKLAKKTNLTYKVSSKPVWETSLSQKEYVVVRDYVSKNTFYGQVIEYSDDSSIRELLLKDVSVFTEESQLLYNAEEVFLSREHNEFSIEIFDYSKQSEGEDNNEKLQQ